MGMLSNNEFDILWDRIPNKNKKEDCIDIDGFLYFNAALDELFEDENDNDDIDDDIDDDIKTKMIKGDECKTPIILFQKLSNNNITINKNELKYWFELQDMLYGVDDLLSEDEYNDIFNTYATNKEVLDETNFVLFYNAIDDLFEDDIDDDDDDDIVEEKNEKKQSIAVV